MKMPRRPWTENELERARGMRAAGHFDGEIDKALGRRAGSTKRRLEVEACGSGRDVRASPVPDDLLAEREALASARNHRTLTEDFLAIRHSVIRRCTARQGCGETARAARV